VWKIILLPPIFTKFTVKVHTSLLNDSVNATDNQFSVTLTLYDSWIETKPHQTKFKTRNMYVHISNSKYVRNAERNTNQELVHAKTVIMSFICPIRYISSRLCKQERLLRNYARAGTILHRYRVRFQKPVVTFDIVSKTFTNTAVLLFVEW
jgi:hypothetical protein